MISTDALITHGPLSTFLSIWIRSAAKASFCQDKMILFEESVKAVRFFGPFGNGVAVLVGVAVKVSVGVFVRVGVFVGVGIRVGVVSAFLNGFVWLASTKELPDNSLESDNITNPSAEMQGIAIIKNKIKYDAEIKIFRIVFIFF